MAWRRFVSQLMCWMGSLLLVVILCGIARATEVMIGLIPEQNVFELVNTYRPLETYIENKTGFKIRLTMLSRYGNIIDHFSARKLDGAFWGSFTGAMAIKKLGVEPIARPLWLDGTSTYHGYVFARKSAKIKNVAAMRGKTMAFVEKATTAGYIFPVAYFREHGVRNIDAYFKEYYFTGSHDAAIRAVLSGEAEIGAAKNTIYDLVAGQDPRVKTEVVVLAESPKVPSNGLGLARTVAPATKSRLTEVLLEMDQDPDGKAVLRKFGANKFIKTVAEDYKPVFDIAEKAGIDLQRYTYVNK